MSRLAGFLAELRRRRVYQVAVVYAAGAFVVVQASDLFLPRLGFPDWSVTLVVVLAVAGFPAALVLSWAFDFTPRGVERTSSAAEEGPAMEPGPAVATATETEAAAEPGATWRLVGGGAAGLALLGVGGWWLATLVLAPPEPERPTYAPTAIAVLPFQNLSADAAHAYFAGGLHDELLTQLSRVAALSLRGRSSVMGYAETAKSVGEIAEELQVGALLEGSVQVVAGRLRVNVLLIDTATDEHLWAERYDRTLDDAFAIQSDIAQQVVAAVGATLAGGEQAAMAEVPTTDAEAYRLYLQGLEYSRRPGYQRQNFEIAQRLFERALERDPEFALALAALSDVHGVLHWFGYDPSAARLEAQRQTAERALELAPDLPQARVAQGLWHYFGRRDWRTALAEYEAAARGLPNDAGIQARIGYAHRRLGNWREVEEAFLRAVELDPLDVNLLYDLGGQTGHLTKRYADAVRAYDRALSLAPDFHGAALMRGWVHVRWQGQLDTLRATLERITGDHEEQVLGSTAAHRVELHLWEREPERALAVLESAPEQAFVGHVTFFPKSLYAAWAHELRGDQEAARLAFDSAMALLDSVAGEIPEDWRVRAARGLAAAGLGERQEALGEARWIEGSVVYRDDPLQGAWLAEDRARILARAGAAEEALDEIERLLEGPSYVTAHTLRLDPRWDPIRKHPRFQALLRRHDAEQAE